ncbi:MAG: efflux RND transporter periplasmic adaptor subunit [Candidatus Acidiferrales bacterium]
MRTNPYLHGPRASALVLLASVFGFALLPGCSNKPVVHGAGFSSMPVQTQIANLVDVPDTSEYLATLKSRRSASINPQVEGWVTKIFVRSGEHVNQGAPLMVIDPRVQEATVDSQIAARNAQAATLANAEAQYQRGLKLYQAGIISKQDFDTYKTTYDAALAQTKSLDAQVNQQRETLHYYTVSAPTDGIVGDIPVHVGDRVTNTTLLTTVDQPGSLEAYLYVPVEHSSDLRLGEPIDLLDDSGNVLAHTSVFFISPEVDSTTQTVLAKAIVPNAQHKFRTDEFVNARITWRTTKGLEVPVLAVQRLNGQFFVFLAVNGSKGTVARQQQIQVGDIIGNNYVVLSGIKPGDRVIVGGFQFLIDGVPVKETIQNAPATAGSH